MTPPLSVRLRRLLAAHDVGVREVARRAGLQPMVVSRITSGANTNPEIGTLEKIVVAAGGTLGELFADEEASKPEKAPRKKPPR